MEQHSENAQAEAYYQRGKAACDSGNYDHAIVDFDRTIELDPQAPAALSPRNLQRRLGFNSQPRLSSWMQGKR
jgi:hypothetical protein